MDINKVPVSFSQTQPSLTGNSSLQGELVPSQQHVKEKTKCQVNFDWYVMEYSPKLKKYDFYINNQQNKSLQLKEIADLILSDIQSHLKIIQSKVSVQKIQKNKVMKPIVMPIIDGKRFAFIFETSQYHLTHQTTSFQIIDMFIIFISDSFLPKTLSEFAKFINEKQKQNTLKYIQRCQNSIQPFTGIQSQSTLLQHIQAGLQGHKKYYFSKQQILKDQIEMQTDWYLKSISDYSILIRLNTLHYRPILLLTLLLYFAIREYKIIIVGYKTHRHIMSEAIIALRTAYAPINYCYPIILSAISEEHDNYIDSPVPALICYWGQERECIRVRQKFKKMSKEKLMPTTLIDLNTLTAFNSISTEQQSRILTNMNNFISSDKQKTQVVRHANEYILSLVNSRNEQLKQQSVLFRKSLAFHHFAYNNK